MAVVLASFGWKMAYFRPKESPLGDYAGKVPCHR